MKSFKKYLSYIHNTVAIVFLLFYSGIWISWRSFDEHDAVALEKTDDLKKSLEELWTSTQKMHLSGMVLVERGDELIFARAAKPLNANNPLFIGSVTKQWTAAKIEELAHQNKIHLDDSLCTHMDGFCDGNKKLITIRHLLNHRSGLPRTAAPIWNVPRAFYDILVSTKLETFIDPKSIDLDAVPGSKYNYSNLGYDILARLIEIKTGHSYHEEMKSFFESQGLKNTFIKTPAPTENIQSQWNVRLLGAPRLVTWPVSADLFAFDNAFGSGAAITSPNDMSLWLQSLLKSGKPQELLTTAKSSDNEFSMKEPGLSYINGWVVDSERNVVWHNGSIPGYRAFALMHPPSGTTAVFIFNSFRLSLDEEKVLKAWEKLFSGQKYSFPNPST